MKNIVTSLLISLIMVSQTFAQNTSPTPQKPATAVKSQKHLSSSILLWLRDDKSRQAGLERWKGPHAKIISANKGMLEYRQIHLTENNPGLWPSIAGVETNIPTDRKIDGIADVTLKGYLSLFRGKKTTRLAFQDEVNLFKRTILYAAMPKSSRWYEVAQPNEKINARSIVFFRIKPSVDRKDFSKFINEELAPALANSGLLKELRSKVYSPWKQKQWNSPDVAHDNPEEVQFQASVMLGFTDAATMDKFFAGIVVKNLSDRLSLFCSAVHAYEILETLTFVEDGKQLTNYRK